VAEHRQISIPLQEIRIGETHPLARMYWVALAVGVAALALAAFLGMDDADQFFHSYLTAFLFCVTIALGAWIFVLIQFVTRAGWSVTVRRQAEHLAGTLPLFVILFLPLLAGMHELYPWLDAAHAADDPILRGKTPYLNEPFFLIRSFVYLVSWALLAWWFRRQSLAQDEEGGIRITRRLQTASAPAIVWFALTVTFASFDWIMSLDPHWYSTIFGVYVFSGGFVGALSLLILLVLVFHRSGLLNSVVTDEHRHDLGKLLFAFTVFWAYIAFSQFMLIWYANIPEETLWYAHRWHHGWEYLSVLLAVGHFVIPFFLLLPRSVKRNRKLMAGVVSWMLLMHYVDLYWLVMPGFQHQGLQPHLMDILTLVGVLGLFLAAYGRLALGPALIPTRDPRLAESLSFENI
jgi:hypothetical protein